MPTDLAAQIRLQYGSISQMKSTVSAAAMGLFSSGWVWFVADRDGNLGVLPTLGPGTLLIRSRTYMGDKNSALTLEPQPEMFIKATGLDVDDYYSSAESGLEDEAEEGEEGEDDENEGELADQGKVS